MTRSHVSSTHVGALLRALPLACLLLLGACATSAREQATDPGRDAARPNVVLIYGDDVGYADVGVYGAEKISTPNIDRLAREGLMFTDGHCAAATCTPSRFALLTGVHGFRHGVRILPPDAPLSIPTEWFTLPRVFAAAGYSTGVVGKWHLGLGAEGVHVDWNGAVRPGPLELGFGTSFLLPSTNDRVPCVYLDGHTVVGLDPSDPLYVGRPVGPTAASTVYPDGREDPGAMTYYASSHGHNQSVINGVGRIGYMVGGKSALWNDETMADVFVAEAAKFIAENKDEPFFLFFSSQDIHVPRMPHPRFRGKSELGYRGDAMAQLDWSTGALLEILEEHGLTENTIVIFTSDNGPVYDDGYDDGTTVLTSQKEVDRGHDASGPFRGGKYQIYEGGTRVPFIVRWPGHVAPGTSSSALVTQVDLLESFAAFLGVEVPQGEAMDSRDTMGAFLGVDGLGSPFIVEEARRLALRDHRWKLVTKKSRYELYDLDADIGEQRDVARRHPAIVQALAAQLEAARSTGLRALMAD